MGKISVSLPFLSKRKSIKICFKNVNKAKWSGEENEGFVRKRKYIEKETFCGIRRKDGDIGRTGHGKPQFYPTLGPMFHSDELSSFSKSLPQLTYILILESILPCNLLHVFYAPLSLFQLPMILWMRDVHNVLSSTVLVSSLRLILHGFVYGVSHSSTYLVFFSCCLLFSQNLCLF